MFITSKQRGVNRDGQQVARGRFLVLCKPKKWEDRNMPMRAFVINDSYGTVWSLHDGQC